MEQKLLVMVQQNAFSFLQVKQAVHNALRNNKLGHDLRLFCIISYSQIVFTFSCFFFFFSIILKRKSQYLGHSPCMEMAKLLVLNKIFHFLQSFVVNIFTVAIWTHALSRVNELQISVYVSQLQNGESGNSQCS